MKIAISIPDSIFEEAELLAASLKRSRSQVYAEALAKYVAEHSAANTTKRLNDVYEKEPSSVDPTLTSAQLNVVRLEAW